MDRRVAAVAALLLVAACTQEDMDLVVAERAGPTEAYVRYIASVEAEPALRGPPRIAAGDAEGAAATACAGSAEAYARDLERAAAGALDAEVLDRRAFLTAYCPDRLADFEVAAQRVCAAATGPVGRACPGGLSSPQ